MRIALDTKGPYTVRTGLGCCPSCMLRNLVVASTPLGGQHVVTGSRYFRISLRAFCAFSDCGCVAPICFP